MVEQEDPENKEAKADIEAKIQEMEEQKLELKEKRVKFLQDLIEEDLEIAFKNIKKRFYK